MLNYIKRFLVNRQFAVKVANRISKNFNQENGVPQGSSLTSVGDTVFTSH